MQAKNTTSHASKPLHFSKREAINFGFETSKKNILYFLSLLLVIFAINIFLGVLQIATGAAEGILLSSLITVIRVIVGVVISMGIIRISVDFAEGKTPKIKDLFYTDNIFNFIHGSIVKTFIVVFGIILFIIPGIIYSIRLEFVPYLIIDKRMGPFEALNKSWEMTRGNTWNLFLFAILLLLINLLGLLVFLVGLFITVPLTMVATAYVYRKLLNS